jgi:hypothetical protein
MFATPRNSANAVKLCFLGQIISSPRKKPVPFEVEVESKVVPWILGGNDGLLNKVEQGSNATCGWCDKICVQKG